MSIIIKVVTGWLGGQYDRFGIFSTKEDAERGISPEERMFELIKEFDGKKVRIIIEEIE